MPPANHTRPLQTYPWLVVIFFASGCAALIYEIVWFQILQLLIGSSAVSLGVLLGSFMGGLCLGSLFLPRLIAPFRHPLRVLAGLELGIGIMGIGIFASIPAIDEIYLFLGGEGFSGVLVRGFICAVCLLPPTILMGATLPVVARWLRMTPTGVSRLGFLYGVNTLGAVTGCLLAGFFLLRRHDVATATVTAAAMNGIIALVACLLAMRSGKQVLSTRRSMPERLGSPEGRGLVYVGIGVSGMCALGSEVVWTRLLSLMLGGTVYTFSIILAVFLAGLGLGSHFGSILVRRTSNPRLVFGWCQIAVVGGIAWAAVMIAQALPQWPVKDLPQLGIWSTFVLDLWQCHWVLFPSAFLWGASFPLALAAVASPRSDPGRQVGRIYAANTIGAITGGVGFSMLLLPWIGTHFAQLILLVCSLAAGMVLIFSSRGFSLRDRLHGPAGASLRKPRISAAAAAGVLAALGLTWAAGQLPWEYAAFGRKASERIDNTAPLLVQDGTNATIAVTESLEGVRNFHVSGKIVASSHLQDMRLQRMLGHLPALIHPRPRAVLIIGCGAGVTAGTFVLYPEIEKIVICEIEPRIPEIASTYFGHENHHVIEDPRVEVIIDDGRHHLLKTQETFDIITTDPIHPWVKGSAALYSQEFFELAGTHLKPGGLISQWVPLYQSNPEAVKSELATFFEVFPDGTIWSNDFMGLGYDLILLAMKGRRTIHLDTFQDRVGRNDSARAMALDDIGISSALNMLGTYLGRGPDLSAWMKGAEINRDRNLRLQYTAGMGWSAGGAQSVFFDLVDRFRYPEDLFVGSEVLKKELRSLFKRADH